MDPATIKEARRLLHDLVFTGRAITKAGSTIQPKDEVLVTLLEKIASKKVEEPSITPTVDDFVAKETYVEKPKGGEEASN